MDTNGFIFMIVSSIIWFLGSVIIYLIPALKNIDDKSDFMEALFYVVVSFTPVPALLFAWIIILGTPPLIFHIIYISIKWIIKNFLTKQAYEI